ncbi:MAG: hypothetical protein H0T42_06330 [Deltaproteobacteria bacterium]|nr:hypothetical protein [Deltaproteobacteria bacterium]
MLKVLFALVLPLALVTSGCGSRCKEVHSARDALANRAAGAQRGADVRVTIPFERANALFAETLTATPLKIALPAPSLGPIEITIPEIAGTVREVRLLAGAAGKVRFSITVEVRDAAAEVALLAVIAEVEPRLERSNGKTALIIGFGPENLISVRPELTAEATTSLDDAVSRWGPEKIRGKVPRVILDAATSKLGQHLTGEAYELVRGTLLKRLGELTRLHLRLPDVPIAKVDLRSTTTLLVVDLVTDLPVRRGLPPARDDATDMAVVMSGSAVAELANWSIDHGHAPRWYTRSLTPSPSGEFRPRFDYVAADRAHPFKVYAFQDRGGCSYFKVGVRAQVALTGDTLTFTALDRELEASAANPVIEAAAWVKYFLTGSIDRSKQLAAHTQLTVGGRALETRVVSATIVDDDVRFSLKLSVPVP